MKRLIFLLATLCANHFVYSQSDFRNGYIVTTSGDTLAGLVDYRESSRPYHSVDFKKSENENSVTYHPDGLSGYGFVNDKYFQSREISLRNQESKIVFLEVIVRGMATLYRFEDIYLVGKGDDKPQQLFNESREILVKGRQMIMNGNQHIGILNILLNDCAEIRNQIQRVGLTQRELTKLIESYNRCMGGTSITFKQKKKWYTIAIGIGGGINISKLKFGADIDPHLAGTFDVSTSPIAGISLNLLSPRISERISFHLEVLYTKSKYYRYSTFKREYSSEINYVTIDTEELKIPLGFRYTFPERIITPYFNLGVSSTIHLSSGSIWIKELETQNGVNTYKDEALRMKDNQVGMWLGAGALKSINKKLSAFLELRYETTNGVSEDPFVQQPVRSSSVGNVQVIIGIRTR